MPPLSPAPAELRAGSMSAWRNSWATVRPVAPSAPSGAPRSTARGAPRRRATLAATSSSRAPLDGVGRPAAARGRRRRRRAPPPPRRDRRPPSSGRAAIASRTRPSASTTRAARRPRRPAVRPPGDRQGLGDRAPTTARGCAARASRGNRPTTIPMRPPDRVGPAVPLRSPRRRARGRGRSSDRRPHEGPAASSSSICTGRASPRPRPPRRRRRAARDPEGAHAGVAPPLEGEVVGQPQGIDSPAPRERVE